ncbi:MAG: sigma-70 family RNA polymerase sigma factor [Acidobacteria bacterium]|nr:sigma-70 family RNA polymerase sigma factor [Acidobacteriota bacterium]
MQDGESNLVQSCLEGDTRAWETLVQRHVGRIFNMAYRYTGRRETAEEMVQEVFLKIHQSLSSYRPEAGLFQNWILRVTRNLLIDHYRSNRHEKKVGGSDELELVAIKKAAANPCVEEIYFRKEKQAELRRALEQLSPELRQAVTMRDIQDFSYEEISSLLEVPLGTVKSRINRARVELARIIRGQTSFVKP